MRNVIIRWSMLSAVALLFACSTKSDKYSLIFDGYAQGTTYRITLVSDTVVDYASELNQIFNTIDKSMSMWVDSSIISRINRGEDSVAVDAHFTKVFEKSVEISRLTNGDFDFTVGVLARAWGFGEDGKVIGMDSTVVDSLRQLVGYQKVSLEGNYVVKSNPGIRFDFNAIAQGYTVDVIQQFLEERGYSDFLIEVGGEVRASGVNADGDVWRIGIDKPAEEIQADRFIAIVELKDRALATSGNYRKFYVDEETGMKYVHTINPKTGYPVQQNLLSVSILARDAMTADAYATAMMVKGFEGSKELLQELNGEVDGMLIYSDADGNWKTYTTDGFKTAIIN